MVTQITLRPINWMQGFFAALGLLAAACATEPGEPAALEPDAASSDAAQKAAQEAALGEMADPFILTISAERYVYLIGLAREGAAGSDPADSGAAPSSDDPNDLARATWATIEGVRELYLLRDEVCAAGLVGLEHCGPLPPPDWLGAPVGEVADVVEINRRLDWLTSAMDPFVDAGCVAGEARKGDEPPHFCSVE